MAEKFIHPASHPCNELTSKISQHSLRLFYHPNGVGRSFQLLADLFHTINDQWLLTYLRNDWKIKQAKHWILSKCSLAWTPNPPPQRSVSLTIFFPDDLAGSIVGHAYGQDDEYPDDPEYNYLHGDKEPWVQTSSVKSELRIRNTELGSSFLVDHHILLSFSTGTILNDDNSLASYKLRPHELLEMHWFGTVVSLPVSEYVAAILPYQSQTPPCCVEPQIRSVQPWNATEHKLGRKERDFPAPPLWKPKLEWKIDG
ncbi:hypothetical protein ID866_9817 [Astraeus odoratus]|nr:hypothetical protein ID866_9817 [Astraeus odoratus]